MKVMSYHGLLYNVIWFCSWNTFLDSMIYTSLNSYRFFSICLSLKPRILATCCWKIYLQLLGYAFLGNESQPKGGDKFLNHTEFKHARMLWTCFLLACWSILAQYVIIMVGWTNRAGGANASNPFIAITFIENQKSSCKFWRVNSTTLSTKVSQLPAQF